MARVARELPGALVAMFVRHLPGGVGGAVRRRYWGRRLGALGSGTRIDEGVRFVNPESIFIGSGCWLADGAFIGAGAPSTEGREVVRRPNPLFSGREGDVHILDDTYLAPGTLVNGHGGVSIGPNVSLGAAAKIYSSSHHYRGPDGPAGVGSAAAGMRREPAGEATTQALLVGPVVVETDGFVGSHAIVLPGVTVASRAWLGAGAVAASDLEAGRVYRAPDPVPVD